MTTYQLTSNATSNDLAQLVDTAVREGEVMLMKDGRQVVRMVSLQSAEEPPQCRRPGTAKGLVTVPEDFTAPLEDMRPYMEGPNE